MKINKVKLITEEERNVNGITFTNSTEDQFPYVEATLNTLDDNFNWWKESWPDIEQMISQYLKEAMSDNFENAKVDISSRFTIFHGADEKARDVIWTGPAIVYSLNGASSKTVNEVKRQFGSIYKGRKIFKDENQLIFLFG